MMITKKNYEAFILDYYEGNLSAEKTAELMMFLEQHPALKEDFENFENVQLEAEEDVSFSGKEQLKKEQLKEDDFIAYVENVLTPSDRSRVEDAVKNNPVYHQELIQYKKTQLIPEQIIFPGKESLKKKAQKVIGLYYYVGIAASVAAIFVLSFLLKKDEATVVVVNENDSALMAPHLPENNVEKNSVAKAEGTVVQKENIAGIVDKPLKDKRKNTIVVDTLNGAIEMASQTAAVNTLAKKHVELKVSDIVNEINNSFAVAPAYNAPSVNSPDDEYLTIAQVIRTKINPEKANKPIEKNKLNKWDGLAFAAKLFQRATGVESEVIVAVNDEGKTLGYSIALGDVGVSRGKIK